MLKAKSGDLTILGLSHENLNRLKEGKPILITDPGFPGVFIFSGETEQTMEQDLQRVVDPEAAYKNGIN